MNSIRAEGTGESVRHGAAGERFWAARVLMRQVPVVPRYVPTVALCLALLGGCERQLSLDLPPDTPVQVVEVGGSQYTLDPSSEDYRTLAGWIASNRSGWSWFRYYTTPPSKGIIIRCGTLELRFFDSTVLDRTPHGDYMKTVQPPEYAFLRRSTKGT